MKIDKDTKLYFSVSSRPGNFGAKLYNKAFEYYGINAIYKPIKLDPTPASSRFGYFYSFVRGLSVMGASGLSVSMPFKKEVLGYKFDYLDDAVKKIRNGNTIVFEDTNVPGEKQSIPHACYNTDWIGFSNSCKPLLDECNYVLIYGRGAVSDSISHALESIGKPYFVVDRTNPQALVDEFYLGNIDKRMLINATPIGMEGISDDVFTEQVLENFDYVFDVVVKSETNLTSLCKKTNKKYVGGWKMSLEQLKEQFRIYMGLDFPHISEFSKELSSMGIEV